MAIINLKGHVVRNAWEILEDIPPYEIYMLLYKQIQWPEALY